MSVPSISIRTGARLHFGPLSYLPGRGRHFGGIGLMVAHPGVMLAARLLPQAREDEIDSPRAREIVKTLPQRDLPETGAVRIDVSDEIPPHAGLGSGTQLSLALAEAVARLHGRSCSTRDYALWTGRGKRSAIGLIGYEQGGFIVDAGQQAGSRFGDLAVRIPFPEQWRVLIAIPPSGAVQGLHGVQEQHAFQQLPPMPDATSERLCRLVLTEMLPALGAAQFNPFAAALGEYGRLVGEFFAPFQGGIYSSEIIRRLARTLEQQGCTGMAQSSWGPALAVITRHDAEAQMLRDRIQADSAAAGCQVIITCAMNTGRQLTESGLASVAPRPEPA